MNWLKCLLGKLKLRCTSSCCKSKCDVAIEPQQHRSTIESPSDII